MQQGRILTSVILLALTVSTVAYSSTTAKDPASTSSVSIDAHGAKWAPDPAREFRAAQCDLRASDTPQFPDTAGMRIVEINAETPLESSSTLVFPVAPAGIWWSETAAFGSTQGTTVTAGHVDYAPGVLSETGGELSDFWGNLHDGEVEECSHIFVTDFDGGHHEYVITDKYTVNQAELESTTDALTHNGLTLITCSGKTIEDVGGKNQFNYEKNLVLYGQDITGSSEA